MCTISISDAGMRRVWPANAMKIKYLSVLFCALAAVSCGPGTQSDLFAFPATQKLTLDSISVGEILQPFEWMPVGDKAVLSSPRSDSLFWVYRLPGFEFLYAFGSKGEGPYEFAYSGQLIPDVQMQQRFLSATAPRYFRVAWTMKRFPMCNGSPLRMRLARKCGSTIRSWCPCG